MADKGSGEVVVVYGDKQYRYANAEAAAAGRHTIIEAWLHSEFDNMAGIEDFVSAKDVDELLGGSYLDGGRNADWLSAMVARVAPDGLLDGYTVWVIEADSAGGPEREGYAFAIARAGAEDDPAECMTVAIIGEVATLLQLMQDRFYWANIRAGNVKDLVAATERELKMV